MQTYFDYFLEIAHFPLHITLYINAREKVRQKENRGMKKKGATIQNEKSECKKNSKKSFGNYILVDTKNGNPAKSFGQLNLLFRENMPIESGIWLRAKTFLPQGKKSFEPAQKTFRLGANKIKKLF